MKVLDLFCGGGGASRGYADAGFEVVGIDHAPQAHYPYEFVLADVMDLDWAAMIDQFDLVHASPPCQRHSRLAGRHGRHGRLGDHPDYIGRLRAVLDELDMPYVIENVDVAPLRSPVVLCGSHFGLQVRRHRRFETTFPVEQPECRHREQGRVVGVYGNPGGSSKRDGIKYGTIEDWRKAMGIDWLPTAGLREALPPAYTRHVGLAFLETYVHRREPAWSQ